MQAADGLEAVNSAARTVAQLVVLGFKMPKLDGCFARAQIHRLPGYGDVPIVILTAFDNEIARAAAEQTGATAFITKPFKSIDLQQTVAAFLGLPRDDGVMASGLAEPAPTVQEPLPLYGEPVVLPECRRC
jgi:CheY-like chemotaxis protein